MKSIKWLLLSLVLFASCKAEKTITVYKEVTKSDTVREIRTVTKFEAVHDTMTIDNPCDSTGILNTFYSKIKIPQGQVIIRTVRGKIQATVNIDSIAQVYDSKYKSIHRNSAENKETIQRINVIPKWAIWFMAVTSLLSFLYLRKIITTFVM
jgi:hypothetical protein